MNKFNKLIFATIVIVNFQAQAAVYKCSVNGKVVYSDTKCEIDTKPVQGLTGTSMENLESNPVATGKQTCKSGAPLHIAYKDPSSLQVGQVIGGTMDVIDYADKKMTARRFFVPVNGKNSYGAYVGEKTIICYTSDDGKRILKIDDILVR